MPEAGILDTSVVIDLPAIADHFVTGRICHHCRHAR